MIFRFLSVRYYFWMAIIYFLLNIMINSATKAVTTFFMNPMDIRPKINLLRWRF